MYSLTDARMEDKGPYIDILICTLGNGISKVPAMLLPPDSHITYTVSHQSGSIGKESHADIPESVKKALFTGRNDVRICTLDGIGLSRNRNNAIRNSVGDICVIADDDNHYTPEYIQNIIDAWNDNPDADIITFQAVNGEGKPLHPYPAPWTCSVEITFRRSSILGKGLEFDGRFGIGGTMFCAGEEEIFMHNARKAGLKCIFIPKTIVQTDGATTSDSFADSPSLQATKGATFRYIYGTANALWRTIREAGWYMVHKGRSPFPIIKNMTKGIWMLR